MQYRNIDGSGQNPRCEIRKFYISKKKSPRKKSIQVHKKSLWIALCENKMLVTNK